MLYVSNTNFLSTTPISFEAISAAISGSFFIKLEAASWSFKKLVIKSPELDIKSSCTTIP